jgi:hypothetical protein
MFFVGYIIVAVTKLWLIPGVHSQTSIVSGGQPFFEPRHFKS